MCFLFINTLIPEDGSCMFKPIPARIADMNNAFPISGSSISLQGLSGQNFNDMEGVETGCIKTGRPGSSWRAALRNVSTGRGV